MSRDYECYCHRCKQSKARSDFLDSGYHLFQCLNCGMCWYEVTTVRELVHSGHDQKTWKLAMQEAYEDIDRRRNNG